MRSRPSRSLTVGSQPKRLARERDVGAALARVVDGEGFSDEAGARAGHLDDERGELGDGEFFGIAEIDRAGEGLGGVHGEHEAADHVVDVAEGAGLAAVAVDGDVLVPERLHDEVGDDAPVVRVHARPVGVEDAHDLDVDRVLAVIVEEQRLGDALAFVVAGARPDRIDVPQ